MFRPHRGVALAAGVTAAMLGLCCGEASAQTASQAFGTMAAPAGEWLANARAGYAFQHGAAADAGATDAAAVRVSGPMSGGGMSGGGPSAAAAASNAPRLAEASPWTAWSSTSALGLSPAGLGQFGVGGISPFGLGLAQAAAFGQGTVSSGGMNYLVRPDLSVSFGYQQVDLGRSDFAAGTAGGALSGSGTRFQAASAAINWRATSNTTLSFGVGGRWVGDSTGDRPTSAWDNGGDALNSASIVAPQR